MHAKIVLRQLVSVDFEVLALPEPRLAEDLQNVLAECSVQGVVVVDVMNHVVLDGNLLSTTYLEGFIGIGTSRNVFFFPFFVPYSFLVSIRSLLVLGL